MSATNASAAAAADTESNYKRKVRISHDAQVGAREKFYDELLGPSDASKANEDYQPPESRNLPERIKFKTSDDAADTESNYKRKVRISHDAQVGAREKFYDELLAPCDSSKENEDYQSPESRNLPERIKFKTSDDVVVEVDLDVYATMKTILNMLEDLPWDPTCDPILLPNVSEKDLNNYIQFIVQTWPNRRHRPYADRPEVEELDKEEEPKAEENAFLKTLNMDELFSLFHPTTNFLDCKLALHTIAAHIASLIKNKSPEEIQQTFKVHADKLKSAVSTSTTDDGAAMATTEDEEDTAALSAAVAADQATTSDS